MDKKSGNWYFLALSDFAGKAVGEAKDGAFNIDILEKGNEVHSVQLLQHLGIAKGYTYIIQFDAIADADRTISVKLGGDDDNGWAVYSSQYSTSLPPAYCCPLATVRAPVRPSTTASLTRVWALMAAGASV